MKADFIKASGKITDCLPGTMFKVKLDNSDRSLLCHLSGKMRVNSIRLLVGDKVDVEISPYDLTKGRICYRSK
jgi:translation initiation factor IF-1